MSLKLKAAVEPENVAEAMEIPFLKRVTPVIALGFPVPATDRVNPVMTPKTLLGLASTIC